MKRFLLTLLALFALVLPNAVAFASNEDWEQVISILNSRTAFRWGEENLVWVVHYPPELVEPWVAAQTEKRKMTKRQADEFRKTFVEELRIGETTPILLAVNSHGATPISIAPLSKSVVLIDASGKRIAPIVFEKKLDGKLQGLVQGFVFFPRQTDNDFRIAIKGLAPIGETVFAFMNDTPVVIKTKESGGVKPPPKEEVVRIPEAPKKPPKKTPKSQDEKPYNIQGETFPPVSANQQEAAQEQDPSPPQASALPPPATPRAIEPRALTQNQALEAFLKSWIQGDTESMYSLLSSESRNRLSSELFNREALAAGAFRQGLKDGYKVSWEGATATVTVSRKVFFLRTLTSKKINFVKENGSYRVSW